MNDEIRTALVILILVAATPSWAIETQESNPLLGSWKWDIGINDCKIPDFVFMAASAIFNGDADGTPVSSTFQNTQYERQSDTKYLVDFGTDVGLTGTLTEQSALIEIKNINSIVIDRKPKGNVEYDIKLTRCL